MKQTIIGIRELLRYSSNGVKILNTACVLFGLAAFGYLAIWVVEHAGPSPRAASSVTLTSGSSSGRRDCDYFPEHQVNQATTNEEPVATL